MKWNVKLLIFSIIAGVVAAVVDVLLYRGLVDTMSARVLIPLLFAIFAVIVGATVSVYMAFFGEGAEGVLFLDGRTMLIIGTACVLVLLFFASMLLEWIYDSEHTRTQASTSYIFVLDESGSMYGSDPNLERYSAVQTVMDNMSDDTLYAVYMFSNECVQIRPMADATGGTLVRPDDADTTMMGSTYMRDALETVLDDIKSGKLNAGQAPHVILLTDGYASDMSTLTGQAVLRAMKKENIRVSTVGLGQVDRTLMQKIANATGGSFVMVNNAADLAQGFTNVAVVDTQRDLLSDRPGTGALYFFLRVLFLVVLGALMGCLKGIACGDDFVLNLLVTVGAALVGALLMELLLSFAVPAIIPQIIFWILMSITLNRIPLPSYTTSHGSMQVQSPFVTHSGGSSASGSKIQW